jgi:hypothetical protein
MKSPPAANCRGSLALKVVLSDHGSALTCVRRNRYRRRGAVADAMAPARRPAGKVQVMAVTWWSRRTRRPASADFKDALDKGKRRYPRPARSPPTTAARRSPMLAAGR